MSGRAARNAEGRVIMYADVITQSMKKAIDESKRRREKQMRYNEEHGITPRTVSKTKEEIIKQTSVLEIKADEPQPYIEPDETSIAADPIAQYMSSDQMKRSIEETKKRMLKASKDMDFIEAARLRDEMYALEKQFEEAFGKSAN